MGTRARLHLASRCIKPFLNSGKQVLTGDFRGVLQLWDVKEKERTAMTAGELGK